MTKTCDIQYSKCEHKTSRPHHTRAVRSVNKRKTSKTVIRRKYAPVKRRQSVRRVTPVRRTSIRRSTPIRRAVPKRAVPKRAVPKQKTSKIRIRRRVMSAPVKRSKRVTRSKPRVASTRVRTVTRSKSRVARPRNVSQQRERNTNINVINKVTNTSPARRATVRAPRRQRTSRPRRVQRVRSTRRTRGSNKIVKGAAVLGAAGLLGMLAKQAFKERGRSQVAPATTTSSRVTTPDESDNESVYTHDSDGTDGTDRGEDEGFFTSILSARYPDLASTQTQTQTPTARINTIAVSDTPSVMDRMKTFFRVNKEASQIREMKKAIPKTLFQEELIDDKGKKEVDKQVSEANKVIIAIGKQQQEIINKIQGLQKAIDKGQKGGDVEKIAIKVEDYKQNLKGLKEFIAARGDETRNVINKKLWKKNVNEAHERIEELERVILAQLDIMNKKIDKFDKSITSHVLEICGSNQEPEYYASIMKKLDKLALNRVTQGTVGNILRMPNDANDAMLERLDMLINVLMAKKRRGISGWSGDDDIDGLDYEKDTKIKQLYRKIRDCREGDGDDRGLRRPGMGGGLGLGLGGLGGLLGKKKSGCFEDMEQGIMSVDKISKLLKGRRDTADFDTTGVVARLLGVNPTTITPTRKGGDDEGVVSTLLGGRRRADDSNWGHGLNEDDDVTGKRRPFDISGVKLKKVITTTGDVVEVAVTNGRSPPALPPRKQKTIEKKNIAPVMQQWAYEKKLPDKVLRLFDGGYWVMDNEKCIADIISGDNSLFRVEDNGKTIGINGTDIENSRNGIMKFITAAFRCDVLMDGGDRLDKTNKAIILALLFGTIMAGNCVDGGSEKTKCGPGLTNEDVVYVCKDPNGYEGCDCNDVWKIDARNIDSLYSSTPTKNGLKELTTTEYFNFKIGQLIEHADENCAKDIFINLMIGDTNYAYNDNYIKLYSQFCEDGGSHYSRDNDSRRSTKEGCDKIANKLKFYIIPAGKGESMYNVTPIIGVKEGKGKIYNVSDLSVLNGNVLTNAIDITASNYKKFNTSTDVLSGCSISTSMGDFGIFNNVLREKYFLANSSFVRSIKENGIDKIKTYFCLRDSRAPDFSLLLNKYASIEEANSYLIDGDTIVYSDSKISSSYESTIKGNINFGVFKKGIMRNLETGVPINLDSVVEIYYAGIFPSAFLLPSA